MRRFIGVLLIIGLLTVAGCSTTSADRLIATQELHLAAIKVMTAMVEAGEIGKTEAQRIGLGLRVVQRALLVWEARLNAGLDTDEIETDAKTKLVEIKEQLNGDQ